MPSSWASEGLTHSVAEFRIWTWFSEEKVGFSRLLWTMHAKWWNRTKRTGKLATVSEELYLSASVPVTGVAELHSMHLDPGLEVATV